MNSFQTSTVPGVPGPPHTAARQRVFQEIHQRLDPAKDPKSEDHYSILAPYPTKLPDERTPAQQRCQRIMDLSRIDFRYFRSKVRPAYRVEDILISGKKSQTEHIRIMSPEAFKNLDDFYLIILHEMVHWTGRFSRLARFDKYPPIMETQECWIEEMTAVMSSICLAEVLGLEPGIPVHQDVAQVLDQMDITREDIFKLDITREDIFKQSVSGPVLDAVGYILDLEDPKKRKKSTRKASFSSRIRKILGYPPEPSPKQKPSGVCASQAH